MTPQALQTLIANGEDTRHQFKRDFAHTDSLAAELVAFANGLDGVLLIGVADDGSVQGLNSSDGTGIPRAVAAWHQVALQDDRRAHQFKAIVQRTLEAQQPGGGVSEGVSHDSVDSLLRLIARQPGLRAPALAKALNTSPKNIERWLRQLRQASAIEPKSGSWTHPSVP